MPYDVFIDSFGARWQDPPPPRYRAAVLAINLTDALLNPPDDPSLADIVARQTGQDAGVRDYVLATPGAARIIDDAVHELTALRAATDDYHPVQLLVNCWYGRHRAPAIADAIGRRIQEIGATVAVTHHHINRPPVPRKHPRPDCPFCAIIHGGAPATVIHEWADALAIVPRSGGCTDGHLLVLPRGHVDDFTTDPVVSATVQLRAAELAQQLGGQWNYLTSCGGRPRRPCSTSTATWSPAPLATALPSPGPTPPANRSPPDEVPLPPLPRARRPSL